MNGMADIISQRRMAENEAYFRQANTSVVESLKNLQEIADTDKSSYSLPDLNIPIGFYCECSDENCRQRIRVKPSFYEKVHKNNSQFILCPGHHAPEIERIMKSEKNYIIVEKYITPPKKADKLHKTELENT